jgi:hypothetical protein
MYSGDIDWVTLVTHNDIVVQEQSMGERDVAPPPIAVWISAECLPVGKVPLPAFSRIESVLLLALGTAMSSVLTPVKAPTARAQSGRGTRAGNAPIGKRITM